MYTEVIYEKKYPHIDAIPKFVQAKQMADNAQETRIPPVPERLVTFPINRPLFEIPDRISQSESFIQNAITISELYQLDTRIERYNDHISVSYSFDCGGVLF